MRARALRRGLGAFRRLRSRYGQPRGRVTACSAAHLAAAVNQLAHADALDRLITGRAWEGRRPRPRRRGLVAWAALAVVLAVVLLSSWRLVI
jgi:hypothetical protein